MKKVIIFHFTYSGNENAGQRTTRKTYSIFKRKSAIVDEFFDWTKQELSDVHEMTKEECCITNMQIIGL
jgi:hypothetical protein